MRPALQLLKRSAWKGPFIVPLPIKEAREKNIPIRTNARSCTILPNMVGLKFQVHNGKEYVAFEVVEDMVGTKLGEYAPTRVRHVFKKGK
ncbi:small ribosomal subunit protein uS19m [Trichomonascus vanleenenianus]|uniref:mitochondrial 37S ribosomal protein uS19m RSM19 n=1 Tax=Trichomonascus vanleenenianus TaxID=2268995 RepID=UPI003EC96B86